MSDNSYTLFATATPGEEWEVEASMNGEVVFHAEAVADWNLKQTMETARKQITYLRGQNK